jgi:hypothetical protein
MKATFTSTGILKRLLISGLFFQLIFQTKLFSQDFSWMNQYTATYFSFLSKLAADEQGNSFALTKFTGSMTVGSTLFTSSQGAWIIASHNSAGDLQWAKKAERVQLVDIEARGGISYAIGNFEMGGATVGSHTFAANAGGVDAFLVRFNASGFPTLAFAVYGPDAQSINDVDVDAAGNIYVAGLGKDSTYIGDTVFDAGNLSGFLAKFSPSGNLLWLRTAEGSNISHITVNSTGTRLYVLATAGANDTVTFSGSNIPFTLGSQPGAIENGVFLASFDGNGTHLGVQEVERSYYGPNPSAIENDGSDNVYVLLSNKYSSFRLAKYSSALKLQWNKLDPISQMAGTLDLAIDLGGSVLVSGITYNPANFSGVMHLDEDGPGGFVVKYTPGGKVIWLQGVYNEGNNEAVVTGIDVDQLGDIYVNGAFNGSAEFKPLGTFSATGQMDIFVARIQGLSAYEGLNEEGSGRIFLYPSVTDRNVTIVYGDNAGSGAAKKLIVHDVSGRMLTQRTLPSGDSYSLDLGYDAGLYLITVVFDNGTVATKRVLVTK